jgi:hypothetical protein
VLYGTGAPSSGVGNNGDFYIDTAASRIYGPKASGAWPSGTSLVGPLGPAGTNGTNGTNGAGFANGSQGGQIYLTSTSSPYAPASPQTATGDVTISSGAVTTIGTGKVTASKIATGTITASQISSTASITGSQLSASADITGSQIANFTITGANSGSGNIASSTITGANIADSSIGVGKLNATGSASGTTYLRGDGAWATPASGGGATGGSPSGIPYTMTYHSMSTTIVYMGPVGTGAGTAPSMGFSLIAPTACTPSGSWWTFVPGLSSGAPITASIYVVETTTTATGSDWATTGSPVASCTLDTTAAGGNPGSPATCSATASSTVPAGTVLTIKLSGSGLPSTTTSIYQAFSCQ